MQSVRQANPLHTRTRSHEEFAAMQTKALRLRRREKLLRSVETPVPETDTGGLVEKTKVNGRTIVKELCKLTP